MPSVDLSLVFQQSLFWRIQMVASFLRRMFFFKLKKWWLTKTPALSCGNVSILLGNSFGERFLRSRKEIWVKNVRHFNGTSHVLVQHPSTTTEITVLFLGLTENSWPPASQQSADYRRNDFCLPCSCIKGLESTWFCPGMEKKKKSKKMLAG